MNVITDIEELKKLQKEYFKFPKWRKKQLIRKILGIIENMEVPKVIAIVPNTFETMEKN